MLESSSVHLFLRLIDHEKIRSKKSQRESTMKILCMRLGINKPRLDADAQFS